MVDLPFKMPYHMQCCYTLVTVMVTASKVVGSQNLQVPLPDHGKTSLNT